MKKKRIVLIAVLAAVVVLAVLCIPVRYELSSSGSYGYIAVLYRIYKSQWTGTVTLDGENVYLVGTMVKILGVTAFDNMQLVKETHDGYVPLPTLSPGETSVLYVCDPSGKVHTFHPRSDGMYDLELEDEIWVRMEPNGCLIDYNDGHSNYDNPVVLRIGEEMTARIGEGENGREYRIYLASDNAPLPEGWNDASE